MHSLPCRRSALSCAQVAAGEVAVLRSAMAQLLAARSAAGSQSEGSESGEEGEGLSEGSADEDVPNAKKRCS